MEIILPRRFFVCTDGDGVVPIFFLGVIDGYKIICVGVEIHHCLWAAEKVFHEEFVIIHTPGGFRGALCRDCFVISGVGEWEFGGYC